MIENATFCSDTLDLRKSIHMVTWANYSKQNQSLHAIDKYTLGENTDFSQGPKAQLVRIILIFKKNTKLINVKNESTEL